MEKAITKSKAAVIGLKYALIFTAAVFLSCAKFYGIRPFGAAFFICLTFLGLPLFFTAPIFLAAELIASVQLFMVLANLICFAATLVGRIVQLRVNKNTWQYLKPLFILLSQSGLVFMMGSGYNPLLIILSALFTLAFYYAATAALKPIIIEKLKYKLLETELVCLCAIIVFMAMGANALSGSYFPLIAFIGALSICLAGRVAGVSSALTVAFCLGLGSALINYNIALIAAFVFISMIVSVFKEAPRPLTALSGVIAYIMFTFYFNVDYSNAINFIVALLSGGAVFALIPKKLLDTVREYVFESHERAAVRYMISKSRADLGASLLSSAAIFESMSNITAVENSVPMDYKGQLLAKCCSFCENYNICMSKEFAADLDKVLTIAVEKGRLPVSDIPDSVSAKCCHLGKLISSTSEIQERFQNNKRKAESENSAKKIISDQLGGVSGVLRNMAQKMGSPVIYDKNREKIIVEELNYSGVVCLEALIASESIALIVRTECFERQCIEKVISKIMREKYSIKGIDDTILSGTCAVMLSKEAKYDMVFAAASAPKREGDKSGDAHSFIKLDNSRFLVALSDGMGSGERAKAVSETALSLIESFYKAGFSNELVLKSVNKFLSITDKDSFSALDICIVDLNSLTADIIKLGCPPTYIKGKEGVQKLEGQSLPLGATDSINPSISTVNLKCGDMLVLVSDGIADTFDNDKLSAQVLNLQTINPETFAKTLLESTVQNCHGTLKDDSTVVAARIINK